MEALQQRKPKLKLNTRQYGMGMALIAIMILFQFLTNGVLLKPLNVANLIMQNSYVLVLAIGMLLCILTGNIDLSVGSIAAFIGATSAVFIMDWKMDPVLVLLISLVLGGLIGAWQGFWISYVNIPAFIVTLAGQLIFRGLTMVILKGQTKAPFPDIYTSLSAGFVPDYLTNLTGPITLFGIQLNLLTLAFGALISILFIIGEIRKRREMRRYGFQVLSPAMLAVRMVLILAIINLFTWWLNSYKGMPTVLVLLGVLILIYSFVTNKTTIGRHIYAFGGNEKAARLSGIKTKRVFFWVYVNMGVLSAVAGIVFAGRLNAATPKAGVNFELDAIASCYIGGASASGGIGTVFGCIVGGLIMGVLNNGMSIMGISIDWQQAIKGFVLLMAVAFDVLSKKKK
ncbi:MAG TPA: sugar ABC transporter permease [Candidatus Limiplasma sp.]|nr:sugar ABC transporter permease [Candidatus Limiplasma sp.]HPS80332.1 sugar ABC transporter permease [Candidatus Limiplasma sp.]